MKQTLECFAIVPPDEVDQAEFDLMDSLGDTAEHAWVNFCYPALRREGYEQDGYKAKKVMVTVEVLQTQHKPSLVYK